jgi:polar amino acid transport system substrate-binding protein
MGALGGRMNWCRFLAGGLARVALPTLMSFAPVAWAQVVVVGAEDDAAPWSYADGTGYVNDVVRAAFESVGWTAQLRVMPYARCKAMALAGTLAACFSTSKTADLDGKLVFPRQAVFDARNLLLAKADSPLSGCDSRRWPGRPRIGTVRGYEYTPVVDELFNSGRAQGDEADSEVSNLRKINAGHVDAALVTLDAVKRIEFLAALAKVRNEFKTVCDFGSQPAYVAFSPLHPQGRSAATAFEQGVAKLQRNGTIEAMQQRWRTRLLDSVHAKKH